MRTGAAGFVTPHPRPLPARGRGARARRQGPGRRPDRSCTSAAAIHLRVEGVTKRFGAFTALDAVSLEVESGKLVCFLGPSGCGKTTLLRVIAGLEAQDAGSIEIGGRDVSRLPPAQRDFGIVFQSYALFPNLTVAQNVGYGLVNRRKARREIAARVAELLQLVGMPEQGAKYPAQLSGGQQQRVALARALASSPSLLLLDEPLSALDARVRVRLRDEIKTLQRRLGVTTIMVTHDQEEALAMADRIVVMNRGRVEQVGSAAEIYGRPAHRIRRRFRRRDEHVRGGRRRARPGAGRPAGARLPRARRAPRGPAGQARPAPRGGAHPRRRAGCCQRHSRHCRAAGFPGRLLPRDVAAGRGAAASRSAPTSPPMPCATSASAKARR